MTAELRGGNAALIQDSLSIMFLCRPLRVARWAIPQAFIYIGCLLAFRLACSVGKASVRLQLLDKQGSLFQILSEALRCPLHA